MALFDELKLELSTYLPKNQIDLIYQAYLFAEQAHQGQLRKSGEPYITHPLAAACILARIRMDATSIIAAILHDVLEDTTESKETLTTLFGQEVTDLVDGVSKIAHLQFESRAEATAESFRKMLLAMAKDMRVILIKLADRLHNMRTLGTLPSEKGRRIALETLGIYAPIAQRLGMHAFRIEFEDSGFAALHPYRHRVLKQAVQKMVKTRKKITNHLEGELRECLEKYDLPPSAVWPRTKHLYSIYQDMRQKQLSFAEVMDKYLFSIIVDKPETCYRALGATHNCYKPIQGSFVDYIAVPKMNGYQALHTSVLSHNGLPIDIQIRTVEMDYSADNGIIAHWSHNSSHGTQTQYDIPSLRARQWLERLLDIQQKTQNPLEFIEQVKIDLFPQEVFVLTPKGDVWELPQHATPVDLAYAIHSDIGNHCVGARIDKRLVPLSTPLSNGQTVEILTDSHAAPSPQWLDFVTTGRARSHIRHFLRSQEHNEAILFGQRLVDNALSAIGTDWSQLSANTISSLLRLLHYQTEEELLEAIGLGHQIASHVAKKLVKKEHQHTAHENKLQKPKPILIKNNALLLIKYADCCHPIPGDLVMGVLNAGHGVAVHREHCRKLKKFAQDHPDRCIEMDWENRVEGSFIAAIRVEVMDQLGVLAEIAKKIAKVEANIENITVERRKADYASIQLLLSVHNRIHLASVIRSIRTAPFVLKITRVV